MALGPLGSLHVICGCMFSGKTTELIRRLRAAQAEGRLVVAVRPRHDTRTPADRIAAHSGGFFDAVSVADAADISASARGADIIGIDEAHFFGASLAAPCVELVARGGVVIVAGVDRDHRGRPFEPFPALLCEADEVVKLTCPCARCGRPAVHSQRLRGGDDRIVVGGPEAYEPRCRVCFRAGGQEQPPLS